MERFKAINIDGEEKEYDLLLTFDSDKTNKSYIVYSDGTKDQKGHIIEYVSSYDLNDNEHLLTPITDEDEWLMIKEIINELQKEEI